MLMKSYGGRNKNNISAQMNWEQETHLIIIPQKQILHLCAYINEH